MKRRIPLAPAEGWLTLGLVVILCVDAGLGDRRRRAWCSAASEPTPTSSCRCAARRHAGRVRRAEGGLGALDDAISIGAVFAALIVPLVIGLAAAGPAGRRTDGRAYRATAASASRPSSTSRSGPAVHDRSTATTCGPRPARVGHLDVRRRTRSFGHRRPLNAIVRLGIVLLVTMALSVDDQLRYLVLFSIASLLLLDPVPCPRRAGASGSAAASAIRRRSRRIYLRGGTDLHRRWRSWARSSSRRPRRRRRSQARGPASARRSSSCRARWRGYLPAGGTHDRSAPTSTRRHEHRRHLEPVPARIDDDHPRRRRRSFYWRAVDLDQFTGNGWGARRPERGPAAGDPSWPARPMPSSTPDTNP